MNFNLFYNKTSEQRYETHFSHFQSGSGYFSSKRREVVLVPFGDFFYETVFSKTFDHTRDLAWCFFVHGISKVPILKSGGVEFSPRDGQEEIKVVSLKEVETTPATVSVFNGLGYRDLGNQNWDHQCRR